MINTNDNNAQVFGIGINGCNYRATWAPDNVSMKLMYILFIISSCIGQVSIVVNQVANVMMTIKIKSTTEFITSNRQLELQ